LSLNAGIYIVDSWMHRKSVWWYGYMHAGLGSKKNGGGYVYFIIIMMMKKKKKKICCCVV